MGSAKTIVGVGVCMFVLLGLATSGVATSNFTASDFKNIQPALNLEFLEAEYFLTAALGYGLDKAAPYLVEGGPAPIGVQKANLDPYYIDIFTQLGLQEVGHLRAIQGALGKYYFSRPLLNLSTALWATTIDKALGVQLSPPFNPYANSLNYLLSTYTIPYVGLTGYVGTIPLLQGEGAKKLVASLLGVEAGQDAVIRTELYRQRYAPVEPYNYTVWEFTDAISNLRNNLSHAFDDEGLIVPKTIGAEGLVTGNILAADANSTSYARTAVQVLETVYGSGNASLPGGFYPQGGKGIIAESYLNGTTVDEA